MRSDRWVQPPILRPEREDDALAHLSAYFRGVSYSGSFFERLGGGGDRADVADRITSDDLLSLAMLAVPAQGAAARRLLVGETADEVALLLEKVPRALDVTTPPGQETLGADAGPLVDLWNTIRGVPTFGPVRTSKLLARKRPHLVPIYDRIVRNQFGAATGLHQWTDLAQIMQEEELVQLLSRLQERAGLPDISLLRILDVVVWMEGRRGGTEDADRSADPDVED